MSAAATRVVILGAGPAGVGAAYRLARRGGVAVTVIERSGSVGGNAGTTQDPNAIYGFPYAVVSNVTNADLRTVQGATTRRRSRSIRPGPSQFSVSNNT